MLKQQLATDGSALSERQLIREGNSFPLARKRIPYNPPGGVDEI